VRLEAWDLRCGEEPVVSGLGLDDTYRHSFRIPGTYELQARNPKTGEVVARCQVSVTASFEDEVRCFIEQSGRDFSPDRAAGLARSPSAVHAKLLRADHDPQPAWRRTDSEGGTGEAPARAPSIIEDQIKALTTDRRTGGLTAEGLVALVALYQEDLARAIHHQAKGVFPSAAPVEGVLQELLIALLPRKEQPSRYDPERPFLPYARKIVRNETVNRHRASGREVTGEAGPTEGGSDREAYGNALAERVAEFDGPSRERFAPAADEQAEEPIRDDRAGVEAPGEGAPPPFLDGFSPLDRIVFKLTSGLLLDDGLWDGPELTFVTNAFLKAKRMRDAPEQSDSIRLISPDTGTHWGQLPSSQPAGNGSDGYRQPGAPRAASRGLTGLAACQPPGGIASLGENGGITLWEPGISPVGKPLAAGERLTAIAASADGRLLAAGTGNGFVGFWAWSNGWSPALAAVRIDQVSIHALALSPDGASLVAAHANRLYWLDLATRQVTEKILAYPAEVRALAFAPDGRLAVGTEEGTVHLGDRAAHRSFGQRGAAPVAFTGHSGPVNGLAFSRGGMLATAGVDGTIRFWDPATGQELVEKRLIGTGPLAFLQGDSLLACAAVSRTTVKSYLFWWQDQLAGKTHGERTEQIRALIPDVPGGLFSRLQRREQVRKRFQAVEAAVAGLRPAVADDDRVTKLVDEIVLVLEALRQPKAQTCSFCRLLRLAGVLARRDRARRYRNLLEAVQSYAELYPLGRKLDSWEGVLAALLRRPLPPALRTELTDLRRWLLERPLAAGLGKGKKNAAPTGAEPVSCPSPPPQPGMKPSEPRGSPECLYVRRFLNLHRQSAPGGSSAELLLGVLTQSLDHLVREGVAAPSFRAEWPDDWRLLTGEILALSAALQGMDFYVAARLQKLLRAELRWADQPQPGLLAGVLRKAFELRALVTERGQGLVEQVSAYALAPGQGAGGLREMVCSLEHALGPQKPRWAASRLSPLREAVEALARAVSPETVRAVLDLEHQLDWGVWRACCRARQEGGDRGIEGQPEGGCSGGRLRRAQRVLCRRLNDLIVLLARHLPGPGPGAAGKELTHATN
jgi:DNA-directed RNA polymerase specialized sigma24 family protein